MKPNVISNTHLGGSMIAVGLLLLLAGAYQLMISVSTSSQLASADLVLRAQTLEAPSQATVPVGVGADINDNTTATDTRPDTSEFNVQTTIHASLIEIHRMIQEPQTATLEL